MIHNPYFRLYSPSIGDYSVYSPPLEYSSYTHVHKGILCQNQKAERIMSGETENKKGTSSTKMSSPSVEDRESKNTTTPMLKFPMGNLVKSPHADEILKWLDPFMNELKSATPPNLSSTSSMIEHIISLLSEYAKKRPEETIFLKSILKVKRLLVPYLEIELTGEAILKFNDLEEGDPLVAKYQTHPFIGQNIRELGVFLDRYDTSKEVLALLVWSSVDHSLVCLPSVGLIPYPLCWCCRKNFGMNSCSKCGVAKYCSRDCQVADWKVFHKVMCNDFATQHKVLIIE